MRETAGRLNRAWLAVIGIVLLLAGSAGVLLAGGMAQGIAGSINPSLVPAAPDAPVFAGPPLDAIANPVGAVLVLVAAAAVGLLSLTWLAAQVPRRHQASTLRLHSDQGRDGYTRCEPRVIATAVIAEVEALPGVSSASALIRGSANQPELNLDVKVEDRADIQDVIARINGEIKANLETALEVPLRKVGVLFSIGNQRGNDKAAVL